MALALAVNDDKHQVILQVQACVKKTGQVHII